MAERFKYLQDNGLTLAGVWAWAKQLVQELNRFAVEFGNKGGVPTGGVMMWHSDEIPDGWLLCDGRPLEVNDYSVLFIAIGYKYGGGDGVFNLPDYRDRLPMGAGTIVALGEEAGAETATLSVANLAQHAHDITDPGHNHPFAANPHNHAVTDPGHTHAAPSGSFVTTGAGTAYGGATSGVAAANTASAVTGIATQNATVTGTTNTAQTGVTVNNTGSGVPFSIIPPVVGFHIIMKA